MIPKLPHLLIVSLILMFTVRAQSPGAKLPRTRAEGIRILKGCATRPITLGCSEDTAGYLIGFYNRGDRSVLNPLLDAGKTSDGALAEMLGGFYSEVISANPRLFLTSIKSRPRKEQRNLCQMAGEVDGSGMPKQTLNLVRQSLRRISFQGGEHLSWVAKTCLREIERANASTER